MAKILKCSALKRNVNAANTSDFLPVSSFNETGSLFLSYLRKLQEKMHLSDYQIGVSNQPCEEEYYAEVETDFNYRKAKIKLSSDFFRMPAEQQRTILTHELLHVHVQTILVPYESFEDVVSTDAWNITSSLGTRMEEHTVTLLEWVVAPTMPLPPDFVKVKNQRSRIKSKK